MQSFIKLEICYWHYQRKDVYTMCIDIPLTIVNVDFPLNLQNLSELSETQCIQNVYGLFL